MVGLVAVVVLAAAMVLGTIGGLFLLGRSGRSARRWAAGRPRHLARAARLRQAARQARTVQRAVTSQGRHRGRAVATRQAQRLAEWSRTEPDRRVAVR